MGCWGSGFNKNSLFNNMNPNPDLCLTLTLEKHSLIYLKTTGEKNQWNNIHLHNPELFS